MSISTIGRYEVETELTQGGMGVIFLAKDPYIPTPTHNDLLNLNGLEEEVPGDIGEIRLLNWEYAGMGDIVFALGNFTHHHRFNEDQGDIFMS